MLIKHNLVPSVNNHYLRSKANRNINVLEPELYLTASKAMIIAVIFQNL